LAKDTTLNTLAFSVGPLADIACKIRVFTIATDFIIEYVVSFIKKAKISVKAPFVLIIRLS
jgi:hypothetical protein